MRRTHAWIATLMVVVCLISLVAFVAAKEGKDIDIEEMGPEPVATKGERAG